MSNIMIRAVLFLFALMSTTMLSARVERVRITWQQNVCTESCITGLQKQFSQIPGVANLSLNQQAAQLTFSWDSNTIPFTYTAILNAMSMIGLNMENINVQVSGTVERVGPTYYLNSTVDNSRFQLLGPIAIPINPSQVAVQYNVEAQPLTPQLVFQLQEAQINGQIVTISGPIFMPERYPPWQLVIQSLRAQ